MRVYFQNFKNFVQKFFSEAELFAMVKIIAILISLLFLFYEFFRPVVMVLGYLIYKELEIFPAFVNLKMVVLQDQKNINYHWNTDADLILLVKFTKVIYGFIALLLFLSYEELSTVNAFENLLNLNCSWKLEVAFFLFIATSILIFFAEVHIIFYRNLPITAKIISFFGTSARLGVKGAVVSGVYLDTTSSIPTLEPSALRNAYQIYFGRGYGYTSLNDHLRDTVLKSIAGYDASKLVNPYTKLMDSGLLNKYVLNNAATLRSTLSMVKLKIIGL